MCHEKIQSTYVCLGTAKLAGMTVSSDPYAFDDVEDPATHTTGLSDISLKKPMSLPNSQSPWPVMASSMSGEMDIKNVKLVSF